MEQFKTFIKDIFSLKVGSASTDEIYVQVQDGAQIKGSNMWILICAIFIASIGLNMNSTAVIIGAMLISPLMGGIISMAYGFASGNMTHTKNAFLKFALQIGISLVTSFLYFKLSPISVADSELLARTSPTIWDVLIASFGGFAGVIGITRKEKTNVIPGVAIATALMPPLCTAGYGLACGSAAYFGGALYLFFINTFFICVTSIIVLKILRIPMKEFANQKAQRHSRTILVVVAIITILPSIYFGYQIAAKTVMEANYQSYVSNEFDFEETQVVSSRLLADDRRIEIALVGRTLGEEDIHSLADKLPDYGLADMTLRVNQTLQNTSITKQDVEAIVNQEMNSVKTAASAELGDLESTLSSYQTMLLEYEANELDIATISLELRALYPQIDSCAGAVLAIPSGDGSATHDSVILLVHSAQPLTEEQGRQIISWMKSKTEKETVYLFETDVPIKEGIQPAVPATPPTQAPSGDEAEGGQLVTEVAPVETP